MSSLREIAQALSAAWDLDTTLDLIARRTEQVMQVNSCSIYLLEPNSEILRLRASTRLARDAIGRAHLMLGEGLTGWAAQHGQAVAVREAQADPRFKFLPETREQKLHSLLAVPLVNRERVIGAMNVQTADPHDFTADEIELLVADRRPGGGRARSRDSLRPHESPDRRTDHAGQSQRSRHLAALSRRDARPGRGDGRQSDGRADLLAAPDRRCARRVGRARRRSAAGLLVEALGGLQQTDRRSRHCREEADHDRESGRRAPDPRRSI